MSVDTESRDSKFRVWKQDLDARCEAYMLLNTENEVSCTLAMARLVDTVVKIRCFESLYAPGAWNVYVGDARVTTFTGTGAKEKAIDLVDFIESQQKKV